MGLKVYRVHRYGIESTYGTSLWDLKYIGYIFMGLKVHRVHLYGIEST